MTGCAQDDNLGAGNTRSEYVMMTTATDLSASPSEQELRELLATSCRILYRLGLSDYLGHPSVRLPGTDLVLIKPRHSPTVRRLDDMTPEQMVTIDFDG